jgi:ABC-type thiamine transport system substrate-binding protein
MLPAIAEDLVLPPAFKSLIHPVKTLHLDANTIQKNKSDWIKEWTKAFAK